MDPEVVTFTGIVFCPCCTSNQDIEGAGTHELECEQCNTRFTVEVEVEKFAAHSQF